VEPTAFLYRGIAYYENNNFEKALTDFEKVLLYNNNRSADAKYYQALILKSEGKNKEAIALLNNAIEDYQAGSYNNRHYVETLRQLYPENFTEVLKQLNN
tara:strand:+ start:148 stop:447 length:300 start_codon:yes stop_codon:yes gene_type:complete